MSPSRRRFSWHDDPFATGSYTPARPRGSLEDLAAPAPPASDRLVLAREGATSRYPAAMRGAHLFGQRAAAQMLSTL